MFERTVNYDAVYVPFEVDDDAAFALAFDWLLSRPGGPLVVFHAKKMVTNNRQLESLIQRHRLPVVAPPRVLEGGWTGGAVLAPWASGKVLAAIDDQLGSRANGVCVIGGALGEHEAWVRGHRARDLSQRGAEPARAVLDPVVEVAMLHATTAVNHNNALLQDDDKAYVIRTLQLLDEAGLDCETDTLCAWATEHGWTATEVERLREYAAGVRARRRFVLRSSWGPSNDALSHWRREAAERLG